MINCRQQFPDQEKNPWKHYEIKSGNGPTPAIAFQNEMWIAFWKYLF